jgi:hypothetical protein
MSKESGFLIVCTNCGCLSIKIEEPVKSSREAIVYCGDCGTSRGTVGALRDLAVQGYPDVVIPTSSAALSADEHTTDEEQPAARISTQYAELRRLRQQVAIAEWLAGEPNRSCTTKRIKMTDARHFVFRPSPSAKNTAYLGDERDQKRSS